jgi:hypothetical protein
MIKPFTWERTAIAQAPSATATCELSLDEQRELACLLAHVLEREAGNRSHARSVRDYSTVLRSRGHGHLVSLVNQALALGGGRFLRVVARASQDFKDTASSAALLAIRTIHEHGVGSSAASAMILRASLLSCVADRIVETVICDGGDSEQMKIAASLSSVARVDLTVALQLQKLADESKKNTRPVLDLAQVLEHNRRNNEGVL